MHEGVQNAKAKCIFTTICNSYLGSPIYKHRCYVSTYEWKTFFQTTVSIPPLLGQPHQIQPYGSPRADENLQMNTDNDDELDYVVVVAI